MKVRIISSMIGLVLLFVVFVFFDTVLTNLVIAFICALAVYELLAATGCTRDKLVAALSIAFAAVIPLFSVQWIARHIMPICYLYVVAIFAVLLRRHSLLRIEQIAMSFLFSLVVPFSLTTMIYMRDHWGKALGIFYVLVTLGSAWLSDTGAYFTGRAFGKHKLAPVISPKKTVEGAIGGIVFAEIAMLFVALLYGAVSGWLGVPIAVNVPALLCIVPFLSAASMIGDLSASVIKRQFGVKDYGSIMPGHGGIMDRFDSVLMVAPLVFIFSQHVHLAA